MNKAYLLAICLLLTPFTGCIEDPALEPAENVDEPDIMIIGDMIGKNIAPMIEENLR